MKKLVLLTLASAALFATVGVASAQITIQGPRYDNDRGYERDRDRGYDQRDRRHHRREVQKCRPHYTVQDGVCKPYRGY